MHSQSQTANWQVSIPSERRQQRTPLPVLVSVSLQAQPQCPLFSPHLLETWTVPVMSLPRPRDAQWVYPIGGGGGSGKEGFGP